MRILVCGGRDFDNYQLLAETLQEYGSVITTLIEGGAYGADSMALQWAILNKVPTERYNADWTQCGNSAGSIRNQEMLTLGKPDLVIAFPTAASVGTYDMIRRAVRQGFKTRVIR